MRGRSSESRLQAIPALYRLKAGLRTEFSDTLLILIAPPVALAGEGLRLRERLGLRDSLRLSAGNSHGQNILVRMLEVWLPRQGLRRRGPWGDLFCANYLLPGLQRSARRRNPGQSPGRVATPTSKPALQLAAAATFSLSRQFRHPPVIPIGIKSPFSHRRQPFQRHPTQPPSSTTALPQPT